MELFILAASDNLWNKRPEVTFYLLSVLLDNQGSLYVVMWLQKQASSGISLSPAQYCRSEFWVSRTF